MQAQRQILLHFLNAHAAFLKTDKIFYPCNITLGKYGDTVMLDHANVFYQIPENDTELPMIFLHGYGQSRMGWMTTPDGREGCSGSVLPSDDT